jgi:SAM-dependent methyltransferase
MKRKGKSLRRFLYKNLSFEQYLWLLSQGYFFTFRTGLLKGNPLYKYPYFIPQLVETGDYVLDIGANLGYFTTLFARLVGPKGKVFAVEPVEPVLKVLGWNTRGYKNIEIVPFALGDERASCRVEQR